MHRKHGEGYGSSFHMVNIHGDAHVQHSVWRGNLHPRGRESISKRSGILNVLAACPKGRGDMSLFLMGQICPAQTLTSFPFASIPQTLYPCFLMCIFLPQILLWNEVGCKILWAFWMMLFSPMILLSSPTFFLPHVFLSSFISASFFFLT